MRFVIVGSGNIALRHLRNIKSLIPSSTIAILTNRKTLSKQKRHRLRVADKIFFNKQDVIKFKPNAVLICSPASFHIEMATYYAFEGINIFLEKPLSNSFDGIEEFIKLAKRKNIIVMVGYNLRFSKSLSFFRKKIHEKLIGDTIRVRSKSSSYLPDWRPHIDYRKSVSSQESLGGGVILEISHEIDYLRWIFGEAELIRAYKAKLSNLEINVEDYAFLLMLFKKNSSNFFVAELSLDFFTPNSKRICEVIGTKGSLLWDGIKNEVIFDDFRKNNSLKLFHDEKYDYNQMYVDEIEYFINCIDSGTKPEFSINDALRTLKIAINAKLSNEGEIKFNFND